MSEKTTYAPGTPCWIDLATPDQDAAAEFYGALFGWQVVADENPEQTAGYRTAELDGRPVGGVMSLMEEGQPPAWLSYVAVEDVEETVAKARKAGAAVIAEPMTVLDYGRMAILADPTGAVLGLWQAGVHTGAGVMKETGSLVWNELNTRDPEAAKGFYGAVFGWEFDEREFEGTGAYTTILADGDAVGGVLDITERVPAEVPAHWLVYFAVESTDATLEEAKRRGGEVPAGPFDIAEVGRLAVVEDPFGAWFAVLQPDPAMQPST